MVIRGGSDGLPPGRDRLIKVSQRTRTLKTRPQRRTQVVQDARPIRQTPGSRRHRLPPGRDRLIKVSQRTRTLKTR